MDEISNRPRPSSGTLIQLDDLAANYSSITISSSSRFYDHARRVAQYLEVRGVKVFVPHFDYDESETSVDEGLKATLTLTFFDQIARSDAVYVVCVQGYVGHSVALEIGFAYALRKDIWVSEQPAEFAARALVSGVAPLLDLHDRSQPRNPPG